MEDNQLRQFKDLMERFRKQVVGTYDSRNKGRYFHWDWEPNKKDGICYENGGAELREKGKKIILKAFVLHAPKFREIWKGLSKAQEGGSPLVKGCMEDMQNKAGSVEAKIERMTQKDSCETYDFREIYSKIAEISKISDEIPFEYQHGIGEMLFHQNRIDEIGHACEGCAHWTCRNLEKILNNMHVSFLDELGRRVEFGEALARELLSRKTDFWKYGLNGLMRRFGFEVKEEQLPATRALIAIERYGVKDRTLIEAAEQALILEAAHYVDLAKIKRQKKVVERDYSQHKKDILTNIGATPYRDD
ncbi:hypothetical protein FJZ19_00355 [Candidatus Pacearchaeota archaeon]|nr:hypothetical protein [Candidatus Pacearchaeota archaeon]